MTIEERQERMRYCSEQMKTITERIILLDHLAQTFDELKRAWYDSSERATMKEDFLRYEREWDRACKSSTDE